MSYRGGERVILTIRGVVEESDDVGIIGLWRVPLDFSWPPYSESMALYQKNAPMGRIDSLSLLAHSARDTKSRSQVMMWNARHSPGRVRVGRTQYAFICRYRRLVCQCWSGVPSQYCRICRLEWLRSTSRSHDVRRGHFQCVS